jgi:hypothetical protein
VKKSGIASAIVGAIAALVLCTSLTRPLRAQNPGDRFFPVEEGLLDLETGLVWGFPLYHTDEYLRTIGRSNGGSLYTWGGAQTLRLGGDFDNEDHFAFYAEFSNWYSGRNDNDWRIPTRDEMIEAGNAGITDYLDLSPAPGFQSWYNADGSPSFTGATWSSTFAGKIRGGDSAYYVNLYSGVASITSVNSAIHAPPPVRGVPAPPEDDGPGNGNGKGKNK